MVLGVASQNCFLHLLNICESNRLHIIIYLVMFVIACDRNSDLFLLVLLHNLVDLLILLSLLL